MPFLPLDDRFRGMFTLKNLTELYTQDSVHFCRCVYCLYRVREGGRGKKKEERWGRQDESFSVLFATKGIL